MSVELHTAQHLAGVEVQPQTAPKRTHRPVKPPAPGVLAFVCERCERRIRGTGTGFAAVDLREAHTAAHPGHGEKAPWSLLHVACAPEVVKPLNPYFRIWTERIDTVDALLDAMADLSRDPWFAASNWGSLVRRVLADTDKDADDALTRSVRRNQQRQDREPLADDDPRHGTLTAYTNYGCRCDRCRAANVAKRQAERAALTQAEREQINAARRARSKAAKEGEGDQQSTGEATTPNAGVDSPAGHTAIGARQ